MHSIYVHTNIYMDSKTAVLFIYIYILRIWSYSHVNLRIISIKNYYIIIYIYHPQETSGLKLWCLIIINFTYFKSSVISTLVSCSTFTDLISGRRSERQYPVTRDRRHARIVIIHYPLISYYIVTPIQLEMMTICNQFTLRTTRSRNMTV